MTPTAVPAVARSGTVVMPSPLPAGPTAASVGLPISEQVVLEGEQRERGSTRDPDLRVDVLDVMLGGAARDHQPLRHLGVRAARGDEPQDLDLALAQRCRS